MKLQSHSAIRSDQRGVASFMVTIFMILIISIVVLGFGQIIRREQRQALDRNLSSRAFYAAESGVNIAVDALKHGYNASRLNCAGDTSDATSPFYKDKYKLDDPSGTEVTCLTIDNAPSSLLYPNLLMGQSQVVPLNGMAGNNITSLTISWQSKTAAGPSYAGCNPGNGFTPQASWGCQAPLLRIDIVDTNGGALNRNGLVSNVYTAFLYPKNGGGGPPSTTSFVAGDQGEIAQGRCQTTNTPFDCDATINVPSSAHYYARVVSYYMDATVSITANSGALRLEGAQAVIDSTGKAMDIVRRIQVRQSLTGQGVVPAFGIDAAAGLCKRYAVMQGNGTPGTEVLQLSGVGGTLHDGGPCAIDKQP